MGAINGRTVVLRVQNDRGTLNGQVSQGGHTITGSWHERERYGKFRATKQ